MTTARRCERDLSIVPGYFFAIGRLSLRPLVRRRGYLLSYVFLGVDNLSRLDV